MNYASIRKYDVSNWAGINSTLFVSGCRFHCKGCWNEEAQDFNYGKPYTKEVEDLFISYCKDDKVDGVCLLGGEVFQQDLDIILNLVKRIKNEVNKPIYAWTGYTWEVLISNPKRLEIVKYIDVIIDGQFEEDKKDLTLLHKGSTNQREVDVKASLKKGEYVEYKF